ncbi:MAG: YitT family protein, partial [Bacteroidales bacterium]|nr:YitT family protein [Bacteroidales bacterium]
VVLYAVVSVFVQSRVIDGLVYGGLEGKFLMIFSEKPQEIADRLLKLKRGVTLLSGEGAYSGENRQVVCIAVHKNEYVKVKRIVKQTDPNAFVIITGASEVLGKGFQKLD